MHLAKFINFKNIRNEWNLFKYIIVYYDIRKPLKHVIVT
jgi:hypothetical protein